jgi:putative endopeptidase
VSRTPAALALALALAACKTAGGPTAETPKPKEAAPAAATGIDPAILDPAARPCDDFYQYACGGWLARTQIPADRSRWTRSFSVIDEQNRQELRLIAEAEAAGQADPQDRFAKKVGDYYAACVDEAALEARGTMDLAEAWARLDLVKDAATLGREVAVLHRQGVSPLFQLGSDQDAKDATQVIGVVWQGGLSLPDRDYYTKTDARSLEIQKNYREHLARMLGLAGVPADRAAHEAEAVFGLERRLAEAQWTRVELRDPERVYNRVELAGLEKAAPRFPWQAYLSELGQGGVTAFSTSTPKYLVRLNELLSEVPPETWRAYLRWRLLSAAARARALPKAFVDQSFVFVSKNFSGAKEQEPRWKFCVGQADGALGEALGQAWVRRRFGADAKEKTQRLVADVEGAMGRNLDALPWMDDATRKKAREKLGKIWNKVAYPDAWRDYASLEVDRGSWFRTTFAANAFEVRRDLAKIGKPVDRAEWHMSPPTVNAYYNPALNEMVFPAGIMQPPFFTRGAPDAVNYGAIGMVVGHELTHGFDDEGRKFDAAGNLTDWWSPPVSQEFDRRAACVAGQYDQYVAVDDVKLNGKLTLGENIADLGGLKLAFAAYQASRAGKGPEATVAGFTPEQAFFIGYAQAWCTIERPESARLRAQTDPHSSPRWRVNGPLSNLAEFEKAFSCGPGSKMVRTGADRCEVW